MQTFDEAWPFSPLGKLPSSERGEYYDELSQYWESVDAPDTAGFFGGGTSEAWESQHFRIGILDQATGRFVNADGHAGRTLENVRVHVFMNRFFAAQMPGRQFKIQLFLASQHDFDGKQAELVGHSYAADGVLGDYVNVTNEPIFRNLQVGQLLKFRIGVNFLVNKDTERLVGILKSDLLTKGIELTKSYNPVFGASLTYIRGLTTSLLGARGNKSIISHDLTLSAKRAVGTPSLCEGTYLFIQVPTSKLESFKWDEIEWDAHSSRVKQDKSGLLWNHLLLRLQGA